MARDKRSSIDITTAMKANKSSLGIKPNNEINNMRNTQDFSYNSKSPTNAVTPVLNGG